MWPEAVDKVKVTTPNSRNKEEVEKLAWQVISAQTQKVDWNNVWGLSWKQGKLVQHRRGGAQHGWIEDEDFKFLIVLEQNG